MSSRTWDPFKTYDISKEELRALEERAQMRASLKAEWQRKVTNPHRGVNGYIFDPAVQRFLSMRASHWDQFKATPKSSAVGFGLCFGPMFLMWASMHYTRKRQEEKYRTGQVAPKDRSWKLI